MSDDILQRAEAWLSTASNWSGPESVGVGLCRDLLAALREALEEQNEDAKRVREDLYDCANELDEARRERDAALARVKWCDDGRHQAFPDAFMSCPDHNERAERAEADLATAEGLLREWMEGGDPEPVWRKTGPFLARRDGKGAP